MERKNVWSQNCSQQCWSAKEIECHCRCGGEFHGSGSATSKLTKYLEIDIKRKYVLSTVQSAGTMLAGTKNTVNIVAALN